MNCYEFQDNISAYVEKEIGLAQINQFDSHLDICQTCRESLEGVVSVIHTLKRSERITAPTSFNSELQLRLEKTSFQPTKRLSRYFQHERIFGFEPKYAFASLTAVIAIVILSINLFPRGETNFSSNPVPLSTQQNVNSFQDLPTMSPQDEPARSFLAEDYLDDSSAVEDEEKITKPAFDRKIKLVKDQK